MQTNKTPTTNCDACDFFNGICELDIPEKLRNQYPDIYTVENFIDNTITNFLCPVGISKDALTDLSKEDKQERAIKGNNAGIYLIYFLDNNDIDTLEKNLEYLKKSFTVPSYISIVKPVNSQLQSEDIVALLQKYNVCAWKLHNMLEELDNFKTVDFVLDTNIGKNNTRFYMIWDNQPLPESYLNTVNDALTFLSALKPIITPITNSKGKIPYAGCVIPFRLYRNEQNQKCHSITVFNLFDENNIDQYLSVTIQ